MQKLKFTKRVPFAPETKYYDTFNKIKKLCNNNNKSVSGSMLKFGKKNKEDLIKKIKNNVVRRTAFILDNETYMFIEELKKDLGQDIAINLYLKSILELIEEFDEDFKLLVEKTNK